MLESIRSQGKLTDELEARSPASRTKAELEDLYLPYKPKRRTRAQIAREKGLAPSPSRSWPTARSARPSSPRPSH